MGETLPKQMIRDVRVRDLSLTFRRGGHGVTPCNPHPRALPLHAPTWGVVVPTMFASALA